MEIDLSKIKTYVGFAKKAQKIKFGVDDILKLKNADLIIISETLTESGCEKLKGFASKKSIFITTLTENDFIELFPDKNIKAFAILDNNLADAIKKNLTII